MNRYGTDLCRPIRGLGCVGCRNHGFVYTHGYNMPSRWDYCRLKAAKTPRKTNVSFEARGDNLGPTI